MTPIRSVAVTTQATFGRDGAMFEGLLGFVAQLSVVLWGVVVLTVVVRFVGVRLYRGRAARTARLQAAAAGTAEPTAATIAGMAVAHPATGELADAGLIGLAPFESSGAEKDPVLGPVELVDVLKTDAVTNPMVQEVMQEIGAPIAAATLRASKVSRFWRARPRPAGHMPTLVTNSTEG